MLFALLILGLLPVVFLPDYLTEDEAEFDEPSDRQDAEDEPVDLLQDQPEPQIAALPTDEAAAPTDSGDGENSLPPTDEDDPPNPDLAVLQPVIEDDQPSTPPGDPDEGQAPIVEDDTPGGQPDPDPEDILTPVVEDDVAAGDQAPPLEPEDGDDADSGENWLDASALEPGSYAEISGFDAEEDILNVSFDADHDLPDLDVAVQPSEGGEDTEVFIGGRLIAVLLDAADVSAEDIIVTVQGV